MRHECYDQLTAVEIGNPFTSVTWLYRRLRCKNRWGHGYFVSSPLTPISFHVIAGSENVPSERYFWKVHRVLRFWPWLNLYVQEGLFWSWNFTLYIKVGATFISYALITNKIWFYPNWFTVEQFIEPMITMYVCEWQINSQIRLVPRRSLLLYCLQYLQDCNQNCAKDLFAYLAVCCRRALRKVSGWNSSERSSTSRNKESELHFSTQDPRARVLATRALNQWMGSSGPSKWLLQERGT